MSEGWAQASSSYLESLKDEAMGLELDSSTDTTSESLTIPDPGNRPTTAISADHAGAIKQLESGLTIEQFAILLKHNYMGSYLFYKRLSDNEKAEVFAYYQQNPDPGLIRDKILQISKR